MDGLWALAIDLLSRFGVFTLLLIGAGLIIRSLWAERDEPARRAAARIAMLIEQMTAQDEDHARDRATWRETETWLRNDAEDLRRTIEVERRARWEAEDAARRGPPRHSASAD